MLHLAASLMIASSARIDKEGGWMKTDWIGILGTGQSLSVGARAMPAISIEQPFGNLKLSTGDLKWPVDPNDPGLVLTPLVEPIGHLAPNYPSSWPLNIDGETPHTGAANQISSMAMDKLHRNVLTVHAAVGEDGQGIVYLKKGAPHKGLNGRSFEGGMIVTKAEARLAKAARKSFGVASIFVTHGESDCGNPNYATELYQLWSDYNHDIKEITGQTQDLLMIVSQQNAVMDDSVSTQAQWRLGIDHPESFVCACPKYQYPYFTDAVHLNAAGYQLLGEKYGQVFFERVLLRHNWRPLQPEKIDHRGTRLVVHFHVPVRPLVWDTTMPQPHQGTPEWSNGKGFEVRSSDGKRVTINSAEIGRDGRSVVITCATDPGSKADVTYAMVAEKQKRTQPSDGTVRWGLLRDSDPFVGSTSKLPQPNYCVAFKWILE